MTDGPGDAETDPGAPPYRAPTWPLLLLPLPIVALVLALGLWTVTKGDSKKPPEKPKQGRAAPEEGSVDRSLAAIAVQQSDLPEPSIKCSFSGDIDTYLARLKEATPGTYASVAETWKQLQDKGATRAYVAWWGNVQSACDSVVSESTAMDHSGGARHPVTTFSFVVRYQNADSAAGAYSANVFGQDALKGQHSYEVTSGAETGLGPNSTVATTSQADVPLHQAIWQNGAVTVYYGSEAMPLDKSKQITDAVNRRIAQ